MEIVAVFFIVVNFESIDARVFSFLGLNLSNPAGPFSQHTTVFIQGLIKARSNNPALCNDMRSFRSNGCTNEIVQLWDSI